MPLHSASRFESPKWIWQGRRNRKSIEEIFIAWETIWKCAWKNSRQINWRRNDENDDPRAKSRWNQPVSEKRPTLSRKSTAKPLSRKSGKKEAKPRKKRRRKPVDQSFCETCGADLQHYAKSTASKMRSWCKNGQSRCNKQTRKHRTRKQIAEPLTKPCRIELERIKDIQNKKVPKSVLAAIK